MGRARATAFSRRLLVASLVFGIVVLCDILLFGWLIFRSLSQREMERVLFETRAEAKDLAERIATRVEGDGKLAGDLYMVMVQKRDIQQYIDAELVQREVVEAVLLFDREGTLVWRSSARPAQQLPTTPPELGEGTLKLPTEAPVLDSEELAVSEAIGNLGTVRIGLDPTKLRQRIEVLRKDLIPQMVSILVLSLVVLLSAYVIILLLLRRAQRVEEKAREAERMAYIGTLAAGLAHEIRSPLNSLNLNMQMLEEEIGEQGGVPTGRRLLGITREEISRLERLVSDFLLYAKPRKPELREVAPVTLLERVREVLAGEIQARGARVRVVDHSAGARVSVDASQMNQLLLNLTQNALAATEESPRKPELLLASRLEAGRVVFVVEDNGVGMSPEEQQKVFEVFYSSRRGGTGLGLAVVERIARTHEGVIALESKLGQGTRVTVSLPAVMPRGEAMPLARGLGRATEELSLAEAGGAGPIQSKTTAA